jgi:hypothetical protein
MSMFTDVQAREEGQMSEASPTPSGGVSASVLIVVLIGLASGAVWGVLLGQIIAEPALLSVIASFLAIVTSSAVRYFTISGGAGALFPGGGLAALPSILLVNFLIASIFGGLAAHGLLTVADRHPVFVTGAITGLSGGILMALMMISYYPARGEGFRGRRREVPGL